MLMLYQCTYENDMSCGTILYKPASLTHPHSAIWIDGLARNPLSSLSVSKHRRPLIASAATAKNLLQPQT